MSSDSITCSRCKCEVGKLDGRAVRLSVLAYAYGSEWLCADCTRGKRVTAKRTPGDISTSKGASVQVATGGR